MLRRISLTFLFVFLIEPVVTAAQTPVVTDLAAADVSAHPWSSLAKVNNSVGGSCTATVIEQDKVLTAAHCIFGRRTGRFLPPSSLHVLLGYNRGSYKVHALVGSYTIGPGYDPEKKLTTLSSDWAILKLVEPLPRTVQPIELCEQTPSPRALLTTGSYARGRRHVLTSDEECQLLRELPGRALLENDCRGAEGSSGAPILSTQDESICVVGVQVAIRKHKSALKMIAVSAESIAEATSEGAASQR